MRRLLKHKISYYFHYAFNFVLFRVLMFVREFFPHHINNCPKAQKEAQAKRVKKDNRKGFGKNYYNRRNK